MDIAQNRLVSIIMPAYNAAKTLGRAIDSVLSQTYGNFELIVVDDGSADDTAAIAKTYTDSRVKLISQPNKGLAGARNTGIDNSNGQYICFIDSDDWYDNDYISQMVTAIGRADNAGLAISSVRYQYGSRSETIRATGKTYDNFAECVSTSDMLYNGLMNTACNKLYRRDIIEAAALRFKDIPIAEDIEFNLRYCSMAGVITTTADAAYNYDKTTSVLTTKADESHYRSYMGIQELFESIYGKELAIGANEFFYSQYLAITVRFLAKSARDANDNKRVRSVLDTYLTMPAIKAAFGRHRCVSIKEGILHHAIRLRLYHLLNLYFRRWQNA